MLVVLFTPTHYTTVYISATAGVDYTSIPSFFVSGRLTLSRFTTIQCLFVRTRSDSFVEGTEDFLVQLRAISFLPSTVELARTNATVFIRDNDGMLHKDTVCETCIFISGLKKF